MVDTNSKNAKIRSSIQSKRSKLSTREIKLNSIQLTSHLTAHPLFKRSKRIAGFIANNGEQDPASILELAQDRGKQCFLPVLNQLYSNRLWFAPYLKRISEQDTLKPNRYGILEPPIYPPKNVAPWSFDLVLVPLVAFDKYGGRIGMGGGYYDRTFSFTKQQNSIGSRRRTFLLGIAHKFQEVDKIAQAAWDVPIDGIATEEGIILF